LLANPDQLGFVFAAAEPEPNLRLLDRLLVVAERENIPAMVVVNKIDLTGRREAGRLFDVYRKLEYPVFYVSAKMGKGLEECARRCRGRSRPSPGGPGWARPVC